MGNNCCFTDCIKKLTLACIWTLKIHLIQAWYDDRYYCTLYFDTGQIDLDLDSRSQVCKKAKTSALIISQSCQSIGMELDILMRLISMMNLMLISSCPLSIQGRKPFIRKDL